MILSVGYRVNSKRGIAFRRWANSVLKQYVIQGYAINEKRLQALERTVDIQTKMLASTLEVEESDILKAVTSYTDALMLLDQYDHQSLKKPVTLSSQCTSSPFWLQSHLHDVQCYFCSHAFPVRL